MCSLPSAKIMLHIVSPTSGLWDDYDPSLNASFYCFMCSARWEHVIGPLILLTAVLSSQWLNERWFYHFDSSERLRKWEVERHTIEGALISLEGGHLSYKVFWDLFWGAALPLYCLISSKMGRCYTLLTSIFFYLLRYRIKDWTNVDLLISTPQVTSEHESNQRCSRLL